ncbi:recQ [Mytilus edulis]|uniref:DNA 3'-5' helicase n=1 Tax=Mytilus edulis TaxID=6550 RepID=A0A8S3U682_MYTED|nr:recQ [Mytilus edulis]
MDAESVRTNFNEIKSSYNINFELKEEQIEVAVAALQKRNVVCLLPTGFGKTMCMVLPVILQMDKNPITLVISPLSSLIDDQMSTLENWNIKCAKITSRSDMQTDVLRGISNGEYNLIFSSPESVLKPFWKKVFLGSIWQSRLCMICVDEAHCISEWGEDFRTDYQSLHELRSFFSAPVMALTATSTQKVKDDIMETLQLTDVDTDIIFKSPDRPNIFIEIRKRDSTDFEISLKWLIDYIRENGVNSKKIVVYCRSIDRVSDLFLCLKDNLELHAYANQEKKASNLLVEMFHKSTSEDSKERILKEFKREDSRIRCLIATVALGMGLDIRDIDLVIHIGCPKSVLSYWQEAGRCARDGRDGFSFVLYDNFTLSLKTTGKCIRDIIKNTSTCIRRQIVNSLTVDNFKEDTLDTKKCEGCDLQQCRCPACKCCAECSKNCTCQERSKFSVEEFLQTPRD